MKKGLLYFWLLIFAATMIDTFGDISSKYSAVKGKNIYLFTAVILYILSTFIWAISLKHQELSKATVIFNTLNIITVVLAGVYIFNETLSLINIAGIILGIVSIILLSL